MNIDGLTSIGRITKLHGYKGEMLAYLDVDDVDAALMLTSIFVKTDAAGLPFRIERISLKKGNLFRLKLSSIDSEERAKALLKAELMLDEKVYASLKDDDSASPLDGYSVIDTVHGSLGVVDYEGGNEANPLLIIQRGNSELIIPFNEEFIVSIDDEKKLIEVSTPEGLLDLNS